MREPLVRESKSLWNKLHELEEEKLTVTKALEAARMEKGKVSVRLSSVQDEQHQLRNDMETLRVSMQADEKNILEKLKGSQSKNDSFQDKVEKLESQLQMAGENQEMVILHAEYSEGQVETLKSQIQSMKEHLRASELDLITIRSKNENLTQKLQEKLGKVSESDMLLSSHKHLLEAKEQENQQMQEESKAAVEMLKTKWKELMKEVAALCEDPGTEPGLPNAGRALAHK